MIPLAAVTALVNANVSASIPQLKAAVAELQAEGHAVPDYPDDLS